MDEQMTLAELSEASGCPARTIRFYIARGILDGPDKAGRGAAYGQEHLARLERIKSLQSQGCTLAAIRGALIAEPPNAPAATPMTAWWQHEIAKDVMVWVRSDMSPWRTKQVRAAIEEFAGRVRVPEAGSRIRKETHE
jgi:DNA-binding transcriptional MerR regulator